MLARERVWTQTLVSFKSFTVLNSYSAKHEDGQGNNSSLAKLVEFGYLISFSSQSHAIAPFKLSKSLTDSSFCFAFPRVLGTAMKHRTNPLSRLKNQFPLSQKNFFLNRGLEFSNDRQYQVQRYQLMKLFKVSVTNIFLT